jgi:phage shock protein A
MTLFRRFHDILTANLNDLVDRFEDPEKMLRQAVREMDEAIALTTGAAARAIAAQKRLAQDIEIERDKAARCQRRAVVAVTAGDDDRARQAVARRREHEQLGTALEEQRTAAQASAARLRRRIERMQVQRDSASRLLIEYAARQCVTQIERRIGAPPVVDPSRDVFSRVERWRRRVEQAEAEAEAFCELVEPDVEGPDDGESAEIEAEIVRLKEQFAGH